MRVRGGRGYEAAQSLAGAGETADRGGTIPHDCRVNAIFDGSSE